MPPEKASRSRSVVLTVLIVVLWALVLVVGAVLTVQRFQAALWAGHGTDLRIFLAAASDVRAGLSPYDDHDYTYSPLVAWLMAPFPSLGAPGWAAVSLTACWLAIAAVVATLWRRLSPWGRPIVSLVAVVTLFFDNPLHEELWLGQVDTLVLLLTAVAVLLSSLRWPIGSGVALAVSGLVKSWPFATALWLLRRGAVNRWRSIVAVVAGGVLMVVIMLITGGPSEVGVWITRTVALGTQPRLAYSVWGLGRFLFTQNGVMTPLFTAPVLAGIIEWVLALGVIALIVVVLRRPGSPSLAMWNVMAAIVLLLPVSHIAYRILLLPLIWVWVAHALRTRRLAAMITAVVMLLFWVLTYRTPVLFSDRSDNHLEFAAIILGALVALAVSVLVAARGDRDGRYAEPPLRPAAPASAAR